MVRFDLWRSKARGDYRRRMASHREPMEPVRRLPELDRWEGLWVAVKDGHVVAAADTSANLVVEVHKLGAKGRGAVAQFVPPRSDVIAIGVG